MMLKVVREGRSGPSAPAPTVCIVTQLSIDRLDRLEQMCEVWSCHEIGKDSAVHGKGAIVAAILDEDRSENRDFHRFNGMKNSTLLLADMERRVQKSNKTFLKTFLVSRKRNKDATLYPINALRNVALRGADSELVFLVDVDCIPSMDSYYALVGSSDKISDLRRICNQEMTVVVVPCFEHVAGAAVGNSVGNPARHFYHQDVVHSYLLDSAADEPAAEVSSSKKLLCCLQPFMVNRFACGHRATNFAQLREIWRSSEISNITPQRFYPIEFEEGFEPYVIVSKRLIPFYDDQLEGYGRNKALHLYHLSRLGFQFVVSTQTSVIHFSHSPTIDRQLFFHQQVVGNGEIYLNCPSVSMCRVKERYAAARMLISMHCTSWVLNASSASELNTSGCIIHPSSDKVLNEGLEYSSVGTACVFWPRGIDFGECRSTMPRKTFFSSCGRGSSEVGELMYHESSELNTSMASFCSVHLQYLPPKLFIERYVHATMVANYVIHLDCFKFNVRKYRYPCQIPEHAMSSDAVIWAVTHLSIDRLDRLRSLCISWKGPLAASVWFPPEISDQARRIGENAMSYLIKEMDKSPCYLRIVKVENYFVQSTYPWRRVSVNHCVDAETRQLNRNLKVMDPRFSPFSPLMYPVNALRGCAIDIVQEWNDHCLIAAQNRDAASVLLLVLDVDMRPPDALCSVLSAAPQTGVADKLRSEIIERCSREDKFIVLPALEAHLY